MAMTACRECGNQVSDQANTCPSCGCKSPAVSQDDVDSPANVTIAVGLLWGTMGLGILNLAVSPAMRAATFSSGFATTVLIATLAMLAGLNIAISKRQNWARFLFLIMLIVGFFFMDPFAIGVAALSSLGGLVMIVQLLLQVGAGILLFTGDSNRWFSRR